MFHKSQKIPDLNVNISKYLFKTPKILKTSLIFRSKLSRKTEDAAIASRRQPYRLYMQSKFA